MTEDNLLDSLKNTAFTTGAGANCFFQGFIHTLCYTQKSNIIDNMAKFPGSKKLIEVFNREVPELRITTINDLVILAKAMHPLERELIFGPLMRTTLNELHLEDSNGKLLTLDKGSIIEPPHAIAFAHAFGFSYDEYTHIDDSERVPTESDKIGDYYRVRYSLKDSIATLVLRLKSCHFEVGGLTPAQVALHQSKIIEKEKKFSGDPNRPELPGARYYEEPSPNSGCAIKNLHVDFDTAVSLTLSALRLREGEHQQIMTTVYNPSVAESNFNFPKFKEIYQLELGSEESNAEEDMGKEQLSKPF